jgi:flagellin FlaB
MRIKRISKDEMGAIGVGTLIIFIALILVAAIAAAVIISTVASFQERAETMAKETKDRVSGGFKVAKIEGYRTSVSGVLNSTIDYLRIYVSAWDGSDPINVNTTRIEVLIGAPPNQGGQWTVVTLARYTVPGSTGSINVPQQLTLADNKYFAAEEVPGGQDNSGWDPWSSPTHQPTYFLVPGNVLVFSIDLRPPTDGVGGQLPANTYASFKLIPSNGAEYTDSFTTPSGYGTDALIDLTNA